VKISGYFAILVGSGAAAYLWGGEDASAPRLYASSESAVADLEGFDEGQARVVPVQVAVKGVRGPVSQGGVALAGADYAELREHVQAGRDLVDDAIGTHIYDLSQDKVDEGCPFHAFVRNADALLARLPPVKSAGC
jgi:hypothetical protein